ncbi:hypothetical protein [uncultured Clostridium sp.]|uniref:hypothetical protein n=1 Tax=uncultured Clostridium sp. TaxID=59620 RepID=UPI0025F5F495|nr:hypothetical protein [uncultured Clostridium sp.]
MNNILTHYKVDVTILADRGFKINGFNLEDTWSKDVNYAKILYFGVCLALQKKGAVH